MRNLSTDMAEWSETAAGMRSLEGRQEGGGSVGEEENKLKIVYA